MLEKNVCLLLSFFLNQCTLKSLFLLVNISTTQKFKTTFAWETRESFPELFKASAAACSLACFSPDPLHPPGVFLTEEAETISEASLTYHAGRWSLWRLLYHN